jgi:hypothetical protein
MKFRNLYSLLFRPRFVREIASDRQDIAAVIINAVIGMCFVAAIALPLLSLFTALLVALLILIFGPLVGFILSSLYSRVEWTVGRRLGGKASLGELYRLFAWSFLPVGFVALLYGLFMLCIQNPSTATEIVVSIPFLVIFCCAVRMYCSNIIATQEFTRARGTISIILSFVLFLVLVAGGAGFLSLLFSLDTGECMKSLFTL